MEIENVRKVLKEMKVSDQLADQFVDILENFKTETERALREEYNKKVAAAKQACLEELDKEKAELARKLEIFLEAHVNKITREAQKQAAIEESQSTKALRGIKALVEGAPIGENGDTQAVSEELKKLRIANNQLKEDKEQFEIKARRANEIATKAVKVVRFLESKLRDQNVVEEKAAPETSKSEGKKKDLGQLKTESAEKQTTRPVLSETVVKPKASSSSGSSDPKVMAIAETLDGTSAY